MKDTKGHKLVAIPMVPGVPPLSGLGQFDYITPSSPQLSLIFLTTPLKGGKDNAKDFGPEI